MQRNGPVLSTGLQHQKIVANIPYEEMLIGKRQHSNGTVYYMALEVRLVQKLSQNLLMTPQLQQAIKLLQLGRLEFVEAIERELVENPVLEETKDDEGNNTSSQNEDASQDFSSSTNQEAETSGSDDGAASNSPVDWEDYLERFTDSRGSALPKGTIDHEDRPTLDATLTREESLTEHLFSQVRMLNLGDHHEAIAQQVIGNLDRNGYLCISHDEIAEAAQCSVAEVEEVCTVLQSLDPVGVCSRDLSECLVVQLDHLGLGESLAAKIVQGHLDKVERRKFDMIAKLEQVAVEEVYKAIGTIRQLEPRPGRQFSDETIRYIIPDIYVYKVAGEYVISLNEDGLPKLRVSPYYLKLMKSDDPNSAANKQYLSERLKAATWLIKSIHQRQQTIYKVTESIVKFQRDFLDQGVSKLRPLVLKEVAEDIDMHESTVSRVTNNKYVHTPQGVFELKYFFTSGIKTSNGDVSSSYIKEKIKNMIANEPSDSPVSDQKLVDILAEENIKIARRTVAKYRETLGIASSSKRKKLF